MQEVGRIYKSLSGFYFVKSETETIECKARGLLRLSEHTPLVGDFVEISIDSRGKGRIEKILPRKNYFNRPAVANIEALVVIASESNPVSDPFVVDRVTALAEYNDCEVIICINKSDLSASTRLHDIYRLTPYDVILLSAETGEGVERLRESLSGKTCAFTGNTGVGKTSILNALEPSLNLPVNAVSQKLGRGTHTTRHVELFQIGDILVADTPGFSSLEFFDSNPIPKADIQLTFPEFKKHLGQCRFGDCAHINEPDCSVRESVNAGEIGETRYKSYVRLYNEAVEIDRRLYK